MQNFGRQPIIEDLTRTITIEKDPFGDEAPGFWILEWCPVREAQTGNGFDFWPNIHPTAEAAQAAIDAHYAEAC